MVIFSVRFAYFDKDLVKFRQTFTTTVILRCQKLLTCKHALLPWSFPERKSISVHHSATCCSYWDADLVDRKKKQKNVLAQRYLTSVIEQQLVYSA